MSKIKDQATALQLFRDAAVRHTDATAEGDYRQANKAYLDLAAVRLYLTENESLAALDGLLSADHDGIRIWAATFLLSVREREAVATLRAIVDQPGPLGFNAEMTLREWKAGRLT